MRYLVLGCNGMAGHMISLYLKEKGYFVTGFARKKSELIETIIGDALDSNLLESIVTSGNYDVVVNCIGILNNDADINKSLAVYINSYLPHFLADITKETEIQIIHLSTDCVFSGERGSYTEYDFPDGKSFYDRSKAMGELNDQKNITIRSSIVGPDINKDGIGLLNWFMAQENEVYGYKKTLWTGQTTLQLAKTVEAASIQKAHGLFNTVPSKSISKYALLNLFNTHIRKELIDVKSIDGPIIDKSLIPANKTFLFSIPDYEEMVVELSKWMLVHKNLYLHYKL